MRCSALLSVPILFRSPGSAQLTMSNIGSSCDRVVGRSGVPVSSPNRRVFTQPRRCLKAGRDMRTPRPRCCTPLPPPSPPSNPKCRQTASAESTRSCTILARYLLCVASMRSGVHISGDRRPGGGSVLRYGAQVALYVVFVAISTAHRATQAKWFVTSVPSGRSHASSPGGAPSRPRLMNKWRGSDATMSPSLKSRMATAPRMQPGHTSLTSKCTSPPFVRTQSRRSSTVPPPRKNGSGYSKAAASCAAGDCTAAHVEDDRFCSAAADSLADGTSAV
mmetsp:Transcript_10935/g.32774  ORF Transcript_10935/g.32774 Transcript_10935/m.32774 type:complete len:277 (+) Transcript_10935:940-1770(+)